MVDIRFFLPSSIIALFMMQSAAFIFYLYVNIYNIGAELGAGLVILVFHFILAFAVFGLLVFKKNLVINLQFWMIFFLLLICWLSFRVLADLGDVYYLKQVTVATTGGIILFFLLGRNLALCCQGALAGLCSQRFFVYVFLGCFSVVLCLIVSLAGRLHENLFIITGINGAYQRPGNFLSMIYLLASYSYMAIASKHKSGFNRGGVKLYFIYSIFFSFYTLLSLILSQMIGSNSATGVISIIYFITLVISVASFSNGVGQLYVFSKKQIYIFFKVSILVLAILIALISLILFYSGIDLSRLGILGFGLGEVTSLQSRFEILSETFLMQAGNSPVFGNMNVALEVTGDEGKSLHNLFPYVLANLGVVGLFLMLFMFTGIVLGKVIRSREDSPVEAVLNSYRVYVILGMLFFANLSASISWPVLWFTIGLLGDGLVKILPRKVNGRNLLSLSK